MSAIGIIRCEHNAERCPLTSCLKSAKTTSEAFSSYDSAEVIGIFSCKCPGDNAVMLAKILEKKGADAIHFCTCIFAHKEGGQWVEGNGFCAQADDIIKQVAHGVTIPCVKGTAHLPEGYDPKIFKQEGVI